MQSPGSCPGSCVWLCSLGGGDITGRLNLGNLIRDFQGLFFPNSSSFLWLASSIPPICSVLSCHEHNIKNGGGERLRSGIQEMWENSRKGDGDQKGQFLVSQLGILTEWVQPELTGTELVLGAGTAGYRSPGMLCLMILASTPTPLYNAPLQTLERPTLEPSCL